MRSYFLMGVYEITFMIQRETLHCKIKDALVKSVSYVTKYIV